MAVSEEKKLAGCPCADTTSLTVIKMRTSILNFINTLFDAKAEIQSGLPDEARPYFNMSQKRKTRRR
jgi:hypothetical protein